MHGAESWVKLSSMKLLEATAAVQAFHAGTPAIGIVAGVLAERKLKGFLGGGTLRDLLSGRDVAADIDLYVECNPETLSKDLLPLIKAAGVDSAAVDITATGNAVEYTRQNDFSANSLLYELGTKTLLDHFGALEDITAKVLRHTSGTFFVSSPRAFVRVFRLSAELGYSIAPETAALVEQYAQIVQCAPRQGRTKMIGDLLKFLNVPDISASLDLFLRSRVFESLFPELLPLERVKDAAGKSFAEKNRASIRQLDTTLRGSAGRFASIFRRHEQTMKVGTSVYQAQLTGLAVLRLALLTQNIESCYLALDPALPDLFRKPEFALRTRKRILATMARDLPPGSLIMSGLLSAVSMTDEKSEPLAWAPEPELRTELKDLYARAAYSTLF